MAQVRKLLNGSVIKAQAGETIPEPKENKKKYGRVIIDGKEEANGSEEDYLKFRDYLRSAPNQYGATTAAVLDQLARGEDYITSTENKHNVNMGNAHSSFARFLQSMSPVETKGEAERNAISYIRKYSKAPSVEKPVDKNKFTNSRRDFEWYGTDAKGKYQSGNATNAYIDRQINTYLDWLANPDEWGKTNEFTASHYDEPALRAWWDQYKNASEGDTTSQRDRAYAAVKSYLDMIAGGTRGDWEKGKDKWEDARELLRLFNVYPDSSGAGNGAGSGSGSGDGTGVKKQGALYTTRKGDASKGEYENAVYTDFRGVNGDKRMYLLNEDRLPYFTGLNGDYLNGIIDPVTGRVYKYSELDASDHLLGNKMRPIDFKNAVIVANNSARNIDDVYNTENGVAKYLNFTDYANNYGKYNSNENMIGNRAVQEYLNDEYHTITDAALFNPTNSYNTEAEGDRIYGIYDFTKGRYGTSEFGFRAPYYVVVDKDGNLRLKGDKIKYPSVVGANWDDVDDLYNIVNRYGQRYAVIGTVTDTFNEEHQIFMDASGQQYVDYGGEMHPLSAETVQKIKNKEPITRQDLISEKTNNYYRTGSVNPNSSNAHYTARRGLKTGGEIPKIRPLPVSKYQNGSRFMTTKTTAKDIELKDDPLNHGAPLSSGQNLLFKDWWAGLNDDDKRDVYAAGLDVLSAVTALVPSPYTAAGALGLGMASSGLMAASDLHRGKSGLGVAGQTLLNVGLDAASAVPWLGESAAMAKIAKHIGRVGKWVGPIFTALGLGQAAGAISKSMRGEKLNTEDLLALSAGFQSILNIGHVKLKNAGDASLASLRKGINVGDTNAIHKTKTFGTGESAREIKLTKEQAHEIAGTGSEAAQNLRATLKEAGMTDEELGAITDTKLLKDWGFDFSLSKHGANAGKIKSVSVHGEPSLAARAKSKLNGEDNNFSKYGYLTDFGRGQRRRQVYIDKAMKDESAREALGKAVDEMDEGVLGLRKLLTRRAYGRAEQRNNIEGQYSSGLWKMYERPVAETNTTPEVSATSTTAPTASSNNPTPAPRSITLSREIVPIPASETSVTERGFTLGEGTFVNSPRRPERVQLPNSENGLLLPRPLPGNKAQDLSKTAPHTDVSAKINERVERARASRSLAKQKAQYQTTAKVIEELRKPGADPMKILSNAYSQSKLAESEYEELANALEQAINNANKKSRIIDGRQLNRDEYRNLVHNLFLSMFKKGGKINTKIEYFTNKFKGGGVLKGKEGLFGGWNIDSTGLKAELAKDVPRGIKYIGALHYNKKNYDATINGINNFVSNNQFRPTLYAGMSTATPIQDAQLAYWQQQLDKNPYYKTSDNVANEMLKMQHDANIMPNINQANRDQSTAASQIAAQILSRDDRQRDEYSNIARHNAQVRGQGALSRAEAEKQLIQNNAQSFANLVTQKEQDIINGLNELKESRLAFDANTLQDQYATDWLNTVGSKYPTLWNEWTSEPDQYKYGNDFNTWAQNTGRWNNNIAKDYNVHTKTLGDELNNLRMNFASPTAKWVYRPVEHKSGGKVRNRYKNEPWEDVWINQNKATLHGSAKLNDNIIKILLKALK